jgi:hypothetical protein
MKAEYPLPRSQELVTESILSQINPVHVIKFYFLISILILSFHLRHKQYDKHYETEKTTVWDLFLVKH